MASTIVDNSDQNMAFAYSSSSRLFGVAQASSAALPDSAASRAKASSSKTTLDLPALQAASRVVQEQLIKDAQIVPDLGDLLGYSGGQSSAAYTVFPSDYRVPFQKRKHIGIPTVLWEHFQSSKFVCHMGVLPEIDRAWITLDHKLFLWDFIEGQELSSFIDQPEIITQVALVKPRLGVFIDDISHILVVCTHVSVILLGLSSSQVSGPDNRPHREIKLYATDMTINTDGIEMASVVGTYDGRLFMCGAGDGNLYELHYQEKEAWFGKRLQLINHSAGGLSSLIPILRSAQTEERIISVVVDSERHRLYTLSEHDWISVWQPESNKTLRKLHTLSNLQKLAQDRVPGAPAFMQGFRLLSLHVISQRESRSGAQLMALCTNGLRLYFSPAPVGYGYGYGASTRNADAKQLQLVHVRLPPSNLLHPDEQTNSQQQRPSTATYGTPVSQAASRTCTVSNLTASTYVDGTLVTAQPSDVDGKDFLLGLVPDLSKIGVLGQAQSSIMPQQPTGMGNYYTGPGQQRTTLTEQATMLYVEGTVWAIGYIPRSLMSSSPTIPPTSPEPLVTNEFAIQLSEPRQEFVVITNVGISFITKRRPIDYLRDAIDEFGLEGNYQHMMDFRDSFGREQTCAMLLALASGNTFLASDRSSISAYDEVVTLSQELSGVARQAFYEIGDRPHWVERGFGGDGQGNVIFSGRREGLAIYIARLLRPTWRSKVTKPSPSGQTSNIADTVLVIIQKNLNALRNFLELNPQLFSSSPGDQVGSKQSNDSDAWKVEQTSVAQLQALLSRCIEAISFILLLIDYNIGELIAQCDPDTQRVVASLTYEDLVTGPNGLHVSRALVNVIINRQIGQQISIDTVSEILQQRCGSFCSADDVLLYKAREGVKRAGDIRDPNERLVILGESLRLFKKAARILEYEKLKEICVDYQQLKYAKGAIELPLFCAATADSDNVGIEFWLAGSPPNDPRQSLYEARRKAYELVLFSLSHFDENCTNNPTSQDLEDIRNHAYDTAFCSDDAVFHSHLYDWMIGRKMTDALLEIRPPFLEAHLQREPVSVGNLQLLWQLYVKNGQFFSAAEVLASLAKSPEFDLPLETRLEYLTLAVSNAKSHPVTVNGRHETSIAFLTEIEDQLEVTRVQMELYQTLTPRLSEGGEVQEKIQLLQKRLFNITELYQLYAEPFDLPAIKLSILHVSEHRDESIVRPIWNAIFDEATSDGNPGDQADRLASTLNMYGRRFYPSEASFPVGHISNLLVRWTLANKGVRPAGWAARLLHQCGVPFAEVWDILHEMYELQVPPFNSQENVQAISSEIAVLLKDWVEDARRPQSSRTDGLPVDLLDRAIAKYIQELRPDRKDTLVLLEDVRRQLQRYW